MLIVDRAWPAADPTKPKPVKPEGITVSGKTYEDEFEFEKQRIKVC